MNGPGAPAFAPPKFAPPAEPSAALTAAGGETVFYSDELLGGVRPEVLRVAPTAGAVLLFRHEWWHEGRPVTSGRKYVLRTDVLYRFAASEVASGPEKG